MIVTVHRSVARILWRLHDICLVMAENNVSHPLKRHADSLTLLEHIVYLLESGHRLRGHAYALVFVRSLSINLGEFRNAARAIGHL